MILAIYIFEKAITIVLHLKFPCDILKSSPVCKWVKHLDFFKVPFLFILMIAPANSSNTPLFRIVAENHNAVNKLNTQNSVVLHLFYFFHFLKTVS